MNAILGDANFSGIYHPLLSTPIYSYTATAAGIVSTRFAIIFDIDMLINIKYLERLFVTFGISVSAYSGKNTFNGFKGLGNVFV